MSVIMCYLGLENNSVRLCWIYLFVLLPLSSGISINIHGESQETSSSEKSTRAISDIPPSQNGHAGILEDRLRPPQINQRTNRYHIYVPRDIRRQPQKSYNAHSFVDNGIYTPFLDTNALPGSFVPIVKNNKLPYIRLQKQQQNPKFIYGKYAQAKPEHQIEFRNQEHLPKYNIPHDYPVFYKVQPAKTVVRTYSPIKIDVPSSNWEQDESHITQDHSLARNNLIGFQDNLEPYFSKQKAYYASIQEGKQKQQSYRVPIVVVQKPSSDYSEENLIRKPARPVIYVQTRPVTNLPSSISDETKNVDNQKPHSSPIVEENYVAQKYVHLPSYQDIAIPSDPQRVPPNYYDYATDHQMKSEIVSPVQHNQNSNSLEVILKQLQKDNALPHTLTVNNIDYSIKTLVKILNSLKKKQGELKPIIVAEENEKYHNGGPSSNEEYSTEHSREKVVGEEIIADTYPKDSQEGGTPGIPGVDYPALDTIPPTNFNCKTQRYKGFFGDPDTNCQVWHYCDLNGGQASFLCPNGTIFSQVALTCDWWYNVKCSSTAQLYVLNERLYKYILPFAPKFPEDYTGPLVDKYLALKFMEMEEKMERERKGKQGKTETTTEEGDSTEESTEDLTESTTIRPN